jgi:hypothetical protein
VKRSEKRKKKKEKERKSEEIVKMKFKREDKKSQ